jgi:hypothetical protein
MGTSKIGSVLAVLALLLSTGALACSDRSLGPGSPDSDGGSLAQDRIGAADLVTSSDALPRPDGGKVDTLRGACAGLDEQSCSATAGCVADRGAICNCVECFAEQFLGCRGENDPAFPSRDSCPCIGLDEQACAATAGCEPVQCPTCNGSTFAGCGGPGGPEIDCPAPDCDGSCRAQSDCGDGTICVSPGTTQCSGACDPSLECDTDADCAAQGSGYVCAPEPCPCNGSSTLKSCQPACTGNQDCGEGFACGSNGQCSVQGCQTDGDCPRTFGCEATPQGLLCLRRGCQTDGDCPAGFCVQNSCHEDLGTCSGPPPPG